MNRSFWKSPFHWGALGVGFLGLASATAFGMIFGAAAYLIGLVFLPGIHAKILLKKEEEEREIRQQEKVEAFQEKRRNIINNLSAENRQKYNVMVVICKAVEQGSYSNDDAALLQRKLDELSWTYLRLLEIQGALEQFAKSEKEEDLSSDVAEAEREIGLIVKQIEDTGGPTKNEGKQRLLQSRMERLDSLRKRADRGSKAADNLRLVESEQERIIDQAKLIRADIVANRSPDVLSAQIDATVETIGQTNRWLTQMDDLQGALGEMPATEERIGYGASEEPYSMDRYSSARKGRNRA